MELRKVWGKVVKKEGVLEFVVGGAGEIVRGSVSREKWERLEREGKRKEVLRKIRERLEKRLKEKVRDKYCEVCGEVRIVRLERGEEREMKFNEDVVKERLKRGNVVSVRGYDMKNRLIWVDGVGKCWRKKVKVVRSKEDLEEYLDRSGFNSVDEWWERIVWYCRGDKKWMYEVRVVKKLGKYLEIEGDRKVSDGLCDKCWDDRYRWMWWIEKNDDGEVDMELVRKDWYEEYLNNIELSWSVFENEKRKYLSG